MTTSERLGLLLHDPARVVYVDEGTGPCLLDGWDAVTGLRARLAGAQELVLLDPLGFPYEQLAAGHRRCVVTLVLPDGFDAAAIEALLGEPLLRHLTPFDRVLGRPAVLADLRHRGALGPVGTHEIAPDADPLDVLHAMWTEERTVAPAASFGDFVGYRDDLISRHVESHGAHQRSDLAMLVSTVRPGDTVLDVGAHVGAFGIPLAKAAGPSGRLVAFEANPPTAELLVANLDRNDISWAEVHNAAVSDRSGDGAAPVVSEAANTGSAVVGRAATDDEGGLRTVALDDWWDGAGNPAVDVVKLDVEGYEHKALLGARRLFETHHPVLQLEVADDQLAAQGSGTDQVFSLLKQWGYRFHTNALERNRPDDRFEIVGYHPDRGPGARVVDVLCTVEGDADRLAISDAGGPS